MLLNAIYHHEINKLCVASGEVFKVIFLPQRNFSSLKLEMIKRNHYLFIHSFYFVVLGIVPRNLTESSAGDMAQW
jgi:hypothetical protein